MNSMKTLRIALLAIAVLPVTSASFAAEFFLRADVATRTMPDGQVIRMWGFAQDSAFDANDGAVTVPGPMLTVPPGDTTLTIHLRNNLTPARTGLALGCPVSLVIPGQVTPMTPVRFGPTPYPEFEGRVRSLTHETQPGNTTPVDYVWNNFKPGTYVYHSGTHIQCHIQMGLYGGIVKDYAAAPYKQAYPGVIYETSVPVFFSEIDPAFHQAVDSNNYGPGKPMTSTIDYDPKYFLINGQAFSSLTANLPAGVYGGGTLLRLFNMGLENRSPLLQGGYMTLVAEDGQPYTYPKEQYETLLPAGKTIDVMVAFPAAGTYPLYDRRMGLTNGQATAGGMYAFLNVGAGNFWPVITSLTATPATISDSETSQLLVAATDPDGPSPLTYSWTIPPGVGVLSDAAIANPVFTPAFLAAAQTVTFTVTVSDGSHVDTGTVDVRVTPTPTLQSLEIAGPTSVDENTTAQYTALAHFSDGSSSAVQPQAWSVNVAQATIDSTGLLAATAVDANTPATIAAEYTFNGTPASAAYDITIVNTTAPATEVIVDNLTPGNTSTGSWFASGSSGFWASNSMASLVPGSTFTFNASLVPGATYNVYAWWTTGFNRYTATPYQIRDGATLLGTLSINQFVNGGQWNLLGTYVFTGAAASVTVQAAPTSANSVCADAVRFVPAGSLPPEIVVDNLTPGTTSTGSWFTSSAPSPWLTNSMATLTPGSTFTFPASPVAGRIYRVYAWWTQAANRYTATPYRIYSGATLLDTVNVNQTAGGGDWNLLGSYTFTGPATVTVQAAPTSANSVCADAVLLVPQP